MLEYLELSIDELLLDEENPRLGSVASQSEALEAIVRLSEVHFRNLMISIKDHGLDPGDDLYVVDGEGGYDFTVLEGNRRLSALIVLSNPDVLDGTELPPATKKMLARAATGFDRSLVEPIRCVRFDHREDANEWIYRRHTGEAGGEGRIPWGPLEVQRFTHDRSILDVLDFVGRNAEYSTEEWKETRSVIESNKSSNIARILESAAGRKHLKISIASNEDGSKTPMLGSNPEWALKVLCRIIDDVRTGVVDSRDLNRASDIERYFENLPSELQPNGLNPSAPQRFTDVDLQEKSTVPEPPAVAKASTEQKTKSVPKARTTLAPKRHPFSPPKSTKGEALLREAAYLDANRFTISAAFVLRGFVELAVNEYMSGQGLPTREKDVEGKMVELDLTKKADRVVKHIVASGAFTNADLRGFRNNIITKTSLTSIQSLNGFVHNQFQTPTADSIRAGWDCAVPVFIAAFGQA